MNPMTELRLPQIAKLEADQKIAREAAIGAVREMQAACPHHKIIETKAGSDSFGWKDGRRICACCGIEEAVSWNWPGRTQDGGFYEFMRPAGQPTILNGDFVKYDDVCRYRVCL
jgi:hypothetical protein